MILQAWNSIGLMFAEQRLMFLLEKDEGLLLCAFCVTLLTWLSQLSVL
jgi:hypothetical protein